MARSVCSYFRVMGLVAQTVFLVITRAGLREAAWRMGPADRGHQGQARGHRRQGHVRRHHARRQGQRGARARAEPSLYASFTCASPWWGCCSAQFSPSYPRTVPVIELQQRKGLSDKEVAELQEMLDKKAAALVGDVMVYELYMVAGKAGAPGLPTMQRLAHRRRPPSLGEVVPPHDYGSQSSHLCRPGCAYHLLGLGL